jgi:hypothetical protein
MPPRVSDRPDAGTLAASLGVPLARPALVHPRPELARLVPEDVARSRRLLPIAVVHTPRGATLCVAMEDPTDREAIAACVATSSMRVRAMVAAPDELRANYHRWYGGVPPRPPTRPPPVVIKPSIVAVSALSPVESAPAVAPRPVSPSCVLVVQAPDALVNACAAPFDGENVIIRQATMLDLEGSVRALAPFAIVVPEDVYEFDPDAFMMLAVTARAVLVTASVGSMHLEPTLKTAYRRLERVT